MSDYRKALKSKLSSFQFHTEICAINPNVINLNSFYVVPQFELGLVEFDRIPYSDNRSCHEPIKGTCLNTELVQYSDIHCMYIFYLCTSLLIRSQSYYPSDLLILEQKRAQQKLKLKYTLRGHPLMTPLKYGVFLTSLSHTKLPGLLRVSYKPPSPLHQ